MDMQSAPSPERRKQGGNETATRLLTAFFLLPVLGLIWLGGWPAIALYLVVGVLMAVETLTVAKIKPASWRGCLGIFLVLFPGMAAAFSAASLLVVIAVAAVILVFLARTWVTSAVLVALMLTITSAIGLAVQSPQVPWLLLVAATVIAADTGAYFGGKNIGGPKLAPRISPSKTWSGALCGLVAGSIAAMAAGYFLGQPLLIMAIFGVIVADLSIGGDLLESHFKRVHGVKDAGHLLPGHGGFLDRCDGYLLAVPVVFAAVYGGLLHG